jgi:hypothetical protein
MKIQSIVIFSLITLITLSGKAQISRKLQDAINKVPVVSLAYPANRDRDHLPTVEVPQAYLYAFVHLPYAINLDLVKDEMTNGYVNKVLIDFNSVNLPASVEKKILRNAVLDLQNILDQQGYQTRITGFNARMNFSRSMISRLSSQGDVIIAVREMMCTQDLIIKLSNRWNSLE